MRLLKLFFLLLPFLNACYFTESADLLIHNAIIYSVDNQFSIYEAMAVKDGKIIDIGSNNELKNRYESASIMDAENKPIYPGFIDASCHLLSYGNTLNEVDLAGTKSWEEVVRRVKTFSQDNANVTWIIGKGWNQNDWESTDFPSNTLLNELFPNKAIFLKRTDFTAAIANKKALELAGINLYSQVDGGVIQKKDGQLTGLLTGKAIALVKGHLPKLTGEQMKKALLRAQEACFEKGVTSVANAYMANEEVHAIKQLQQAGKLKMNVYGMLQPSEINKKQFFESGIYITEKLTIRSFYFLTDGMLNANETCSIAPNDAAYPNSFTFDSSQFLSDAKAMYSKGFQVNTHCAKVSTNRNALAIYGQILKTTNDKRWRIEHAQIVTKNDINALKQYTIIPSVQPPHTTLLNIERVKIPLDSNSNQSAYSYQSLLEVNGILPLGSNFSIERIDPLKNFYAVVTQNNKGKEEALSREDALRGMTIWAAIANFEEDKLGSLEVGKNADFVILNQDLLEIDNNKIMNTKVVSTYIDGVAVYLKD